MHHHLLILVHAFQVLIVFFGILRCRPYLSFSVLILLYSIYVETMYYNYLSVYPVGTTRNLILSYLPDFISTKFEGNDFCELQRPYLTFCQHRAISAAVRYRISWWSAISNPLWNPRFLHKLFNTPRVSWWKGGFWIVLSWAAQSLMITTSQNFHVVWYCFHCFWWDTVFQDPWL